jgi:hypothetical protein
MRTLMIRYKTSSAAQAATNEALVHAVFDELRARGPTGLRYATYRLGDGVTFVHVATVDAPEHNPLTTLPAFQAFQKDLKDRCAELPVVTELFLVDSFGLVA